ncbi:hypothetical protein MHBO_001736 [Bonamia ostreae]|uniref:FeS cluster biogenesis domain-containing protein n=1 Tax=Bonamia ostreae TaxID=126728 RepID=A0ABV2AK11_9EUKA
MNILSKSTRKAFKNKITINNFVTKKTKILKITQNCAEQLRKINEKYKNGHKRMLRVSVEPGGCSDLKYDFQIVTKTAKNDFVFVLNDQKVIADSISLDFLDEATVDFKEEMVGSTFEISQNPNSSGSCGCNSSFSPKNF